jgi:hypothetical protein
MAALAVLLEDRENVLVEGDGGRQIRGTSDCHRPKKQANERKTKHIWLGSFLLRTNVYRRDYMLGPRRDQAWPQQLFLNRLTAVEDFIRIGSGMTPHETLSDLHSVR